MNKTTVCVLFGGVSTEHAISCRSAYTIIEALEEANFLVYPIGISVEGNWYAYDGDRKNILDGTWLEHTESSVKNQHVSAEALRSPKAFLTYHCAGVTPDVIYPAVHGINCEDGVLQGFLEMTEIPYVGAGVLSSSVAMDKAFAKIVFQHAGIPQVPFEIARRNEIIQDVDSLAERYIESLGLPLFLKPSNGGSSVGTAKAGNIDELIEALRMVAQYDEKVLVEKFIPAREIECAVLGNQNPISAVPGEIVKDDAVEYYDFDTKYKTNQARVQIPAAISVDLQEKLMQMAIRAYEAMECSGLTRVDFFIDKDTEEIYLNEVNTLPGFTSISLYPMAWNYMGKSLPDLLTELCKLAIDRKSMKAKRIQ